MIEVKNIVKRYGANEVLNVESLAIQTGECFGLVGNNGAGKTTLFSCLLDLIQPNAGVIENHEVAVNTSEVWKTYTGAFIDESFLIGYLTPEEYFYFIGELRGQNRADIDAFLLEFNEFFNDEILGGKKYLRDLSKGNQKKVGIVAALIGDPKVIVLDEPFANLDPTTQIRLKKMLATYKENKAVTILISSHDLGHVTEVCERIVVLDKGKIIKDIATSHETLSQLEAHFNN